MYLHVASAMGHTVTAGIQQPNFIHGKAFKEPGDTASGIFFLPWNRLHPQVVCQSPKAYSDSVPGLNLMLCLAQWTRGHSKVKLGLHKIKSEMHRGKWKGIMWSVFQTWLPWRAVLLGLEEQQQAPFCKTHCVLSNSKSMLACLYEAWDRLRERGGNQI